MNEQQDSLKRAYARMMALRKNIPADSEISREWVDDYHLALAELDRLGIKVDGFRITDDRLHQIPLIEDYSTGETQYSTHLFVCREVFLAKLDGVLGYFELVYDDHSPRIDGFAAGASGVISNDDAS